MSEGVGAFVGVILKGFEAITNLLLKKRDYEMGEDKELLQPLHDQFLTIHSAYIRMFDRLAEQMRRVQGLPPEDRDQELRRATKDFYDARSKCEGIRDTFRGQIAGMLKPLNDDEWKTYLTAIANYIIRDNEHTRGKSLSALETLRDSLKRRTGDSVFETPSTALLSAIKNSTTPEACLALIDEAVVALTLKQVAVFECYYAIRIRSH
jgi:hypothetical protein